MNDNRHKDEPILGIHSSILDDIRQLWFPAEFRIAIPSLPLDLPERAEAEPQAAPGVQTAEQPAALRDSLAPNQLVAEFATCLWYLKTKHFKREWDNAETDDDDPRVRRALGRLNKSIELLTESGIELDDPTNKRYPQGGEGMMRPIQFLPTAGLTFEVVTETISPIIYRDDRLIQRGEVFVAVPKEEATAAGKPAVAVAPTETEAAGTPVESGAASAGASLATGGVAAGNDIRDKDNGVEPRVAPAADKKAPTDDESTGCGGTESIGPTAERDAAPFAEPHRDPGKNDC